jgi:hypothetical protein
MDTTGLRLFSIHTLAPLSHGLHLHEALQGYWAVACDMVGVHEVYEVRHEGMNQPPILSGSHMANSDLSRGLFVCRLGLEQ